MKTRIVKHSKAEFSLNYWQTRRPTWYTVEYKTWFGWKPVYTYSPPFFGRVTIKCHHLWEAKQLKKFVDKIGQVRI